MLDVARQYLGPSHAQSLVGLAGAHQAFAFAALWTLHEARLKCHGWALQEWRPDMQGHLERCRSDPLNLPVGYVGHLAWQLAV